MSEEQKNAALQKQPVLKAGASVAAIVPSTFEEAHRMANLIATAGWAPKSYQDETKAFSVTKITLGIMHGMEVGLTPIAALQSIAVINGMPSIFGDGAVALIQSSGLLEDWQEDEIEKDGKFFGWTVRVKRKGMATHQTATFTMADAEKAKLTEKLGPWKEYPKRQCLWRARSWAFRAGFADVLRGLRFAEEVGDIITVTPQPEPPKGGGKVERDAKGELDAFSGENKPANAPAEQAAPQAANEAQAIDVPKMPQQVVDDIAAGKPLTAWRWFAEQMEECSPEQRQMLATKHETMLRKVCSINAGYEKAVGELLKHYRLTLPSEIDRAA